MAPPVIIPPPPLRPWGHVWRYLLAVVVGGAILLISAAGLRSASSSVSAGTVQGILLLDVVVGVVGLVLMAFRRRWPLPVVVVLTLLCGLSSSVVAPWGIAMASLATRRRWREIAVVAPLSVATSFVYERVNPTSGTGVPWWVSIVIGLLGLGILVMVGFYAGARRELVAELQLRAETAEREQVMRVAQARVQERTRIAREMHDVLAHRISLVAMHAGALAYREDLSREETRRTAGIIQEGAHKALTDLRDVLGVLRGADEPGGAAPERPQPTLRDVPGLVAEAIEGGMRVELTQELDDAAAVPDLVGRNVYRMVQETLTNARKHAPGVPVRVTISGMPGARLDLEVRNALPLRPPTDVQQVPGSGMGLTGLTERAALANGGLEHGPTAGRDYVVTAWLPWPA